MFPTTRANSSKEIEIQQLPKNPRKPLEKTEKIQRTTEKKLLEQMELRLIALESKLEKSLLPEPIRLSLEYLLQCNYTRAKDWPALMTHLKIIADHFGLSLNKNKQI